MGLANGPPVPLRIRHSQYVNSCQLARRLGQLAARGIIMLLLLLHSYGCYASGCG